jgi:hypothetical protein
MSEIRVTRKPVPSPAQRAWLARGLDQPGGKLPLFDRDGQCIDPRTIQSCVEQGWAEPWFHNPLKRDWLVCKLTEAGRAAITRLRLVRSPAIPARMPAAAKPPA